MFTLYYNIIPMFPFLYMLVSIYAIMANVRDLPIFFLSGISSLN